VALTSVQASSLTTSQLAALTTVQIGALETRDLAVLSTRQIAALTTAQIAGGLTTAQVVALSTSQVVALGTAQLGALGTAQVAALETVDVAALTTTQVASLTTAQVSGGLTTAQIVALLTAQTQALTTAQIGALGTAQVVALETRDLVVLRTAQVQALSTSAIAALTTTQVAALTTTQVEALTSTQVGALSTVQVQYLQLGTPLVLDVDGDGIRTRSISGGTRFDLFGTGVSVPTGWVGAGDGLLAMDRDGNGTIDSGRELFGGATPLADGGTARDGFEALRALDANGDGAIDANDGAWSSLRVWLDADGDALSASSELVTLDALGITRLDLGATASTDKDNGNWIGLRSSYTTTDGRTRDLADVWFVADRAAATAAPSTSDLQSSVASLVQAMAAFASDDGGATAAGGAALPTGPEAAAPLAASMDIERMVDVLRRIDADGNPLAGSDALLRAVAPTTSLTASLVPAPQTGVGGVLTGDGR
jgi:hypothetical protein